jgi:hypothetical protein
VVAGRLLRVERIVINHAGHIGPKPNNRPSGHSAVRKSSRTPRWEVAALSGAGERTN